MVQRARPDPNSPFLKFLKPGALAQLRDSRISARWTHRSLPVSPPSPAHSAFPLPDASPRLFSPPPRIYFSGPRCLQRKKLLASKTALFLGPSAAPLPDSPGPVIAPLNNDSFVVAH